MFETPLTDFEREFAGLPGPDESINPLPLGHTTTPEAFGEIAANDLLRPAASNPLMGAPHLLYTYYGSPFFRGRGALSEGDLSLPISMLFAPGALAEIDRFLPFDSGAALEGWFSVLDLSNGIGDYCLRNGKHDVSTAPKLVSALFGSNEKYLNQECKSLMGGSGILARIVQLYATDLTGEDVDHRKYCIECHSFKEVVVSKHLEWIAFPKPIEEKWLILRRKLLQNSRTPPKAISYPVPKVRNPRSFSATLNSWAKEYVMEKYLQSSTERPIA